MAVPTDFYYFLLSGGVLMGLVFFIINFLLGGLLFPFLLVKASRGKKLLVKARNPMQDYFRPGVIEEGILIWKDRQGNVRRLRMSPGCVYRAATVFWVNVDDEKNCLFRHDSGEGVSGFDAVKFDELIKRALYRPNTLQDRQMQILIFLVVVAVLVSLASVYLGFTQGEKINDILAIVKGAGVGVVE